MHRFVKTIYSSVFCFLLVLTLAQLSSNLYSSKLEGNSLDDTYLAIDYDFQQQHHLSLGKKPDSFKRVSLHKYLVPTSFSALVVLPQFLTIQSKIIAFRCQLIFKDPIIWFGTQIV